MASRKKRRKRSLPNPSCQTAFLSPKVSVLPSGWSFICISQNTDRNTHSSTTSSAVMQKFLGWQILIDIYSQAKEPINISRPPADGLLENASCLACTAGASCKRDLSAPVVGYLPLRRSIFVFPQLILKNRKRVHSQFNLEYEGNSHIRLPTIIDVNPLEANTAFQSTRANFTNFRRSNVLF